MDTIRARVIGPHEVAGVAPGGTVELDPESVDIDALVAGGHVEVMNEVTPLGSAKRQFISGDPEDAAGDGA